MNEEYIRKTDKAIHELVQAVEEIKHTHLVDNAEIAKFQSAVTHVLYGDKETGEIGMKQQNDEMYKILTTSKVVTSILGYAKHIALWIIAVGGAWALFRSDGK